MSKNETVVKFSQCRRDDEPCKGKEIFLTRHRAVNVIEKTN